MSIIAVRSSIRSVNRDLIFRVSNEQRGTVFVVKDISGKRGREGKTDEKSARQTGTVSKLAIFERGFDSLASIEFFII